MSNEVHQQRPRVNADHPATDNGSVDGSDSGRPSTPGTGNNGTTSSLLSSASAADLALMEAFLRFRQQGAANAPTSGAGGPQMEHEQAGVLPPPPQSGAGDTLNPLDLSTPQRPRDGSTHVPDGIH